MEGCDGQAGGAGEVDGVHDGLYTGHDGTAGKYHADCVENWKEEIHDR